jgi:ketosteroid isomerase-like protein
MSDHPNAEALKKGYAAFATGDMGTVTALFADDIAWHQAGTSPIAGDFSGKDAVLGTFARLFEVTGGTFKQEIHDVIANDDHVVVLAESSWERPHPYRGRAVHVWHVKDGIAQEAWLTGENQAAADAALTP